MCRFVVCKKARQQALCWGSLSCLTARCVGSWDRGHLCCDLTLVALVRSGSAGTAAVCVNDLHTWLQLRRGALASWPGLHLCCALLLPFEVRHLTEVPRCRDRIVSSTVQTNNKTALAAGEHPKGKKKAVNVRALRGVWSAVEQH